VESVPHLRSHHHLARLFIDASFRYGLHGSQFPFNNVFFLCHAKEVLYSRVAPDCHGNGQMEHELGLRLQNPFVTRRSA